MTSTSGLGLAVCMAEDRGYVKWIDPDGSVAQWNSQVAPEFKVALGDRIDGFKVRGRGLQKLFQGNEFLHVDSRAIVLIVAKPSIHTVRGTAPYGISRKQRTGSDETFFVVSKVHPVGSIPQWNEEFPDMRVSVGDIVR